MSQTGSGVRRRSREMALQLLFQTEFAPGGFKAESAAEMFTRFAADFAVESDVADYGRELFLGIASRMSAIDALIQSHSAHWKIGRMGLVDLSVMRIAVFEMKFLEPHLNPKIAIDEAVEVAKKYGSTDSGSFVNGVLDQIAKVA